jgi:hypothetical protein
MYLPSYTLALHMAVCSRRLQQCDHQGHNAQKRKTVVWIIANSELVRFYYIPNCDVVSWFSILPGIIQLLINLRNLIFTDSLPCRHLFNNSEYFSSIHVLWCFINTVLKNCVWTSVKSSFHLVVFTSSFFGAILLFHLTLLAKRGSLNLDRIHCLKYVQCVSCP